MVASSIIIAAQPPPAFRWPHSSAVVLVVALMHLALLPLIGRGSPPVPSLVAPQAVSVRWMDAPASAPQPQPKPQPQEKPQPIPKAEPKRHAVSAPKLVVIQATSSSTAPATPSEKAASPSPTNQAEDAHPAVPQVIPPRVDAAYLSNPPPAYPAEARRDHQEGRVLLRVLVSAEGQSREVSIDQSSGFSRLDEAAVAVVRNWRFIPGQRGDTAVEASVLVPIIFKLRS